MANIELRNVKKSFGAVEVIKGVNLKINHGEFVVFVGPSGCGKSTLLRIISGLEEITEGDILIGDEIVNHVSAADRGLSMVFQSYALYPHMTVRQNLSFGLENIGTPKAEVIAKVDEVAAMLQISELMQRRPKELSGGQRQRVAIGRSVVREPLGFLFDEPLSNLDAELRVDMRGEISALHKRLGNSMIYVTHDQIEAMTMADKIAVLRDGLVEQYGDPLELYNRPANLFVAGFIGSPKMNFLKGKISNKDMLEIVLDSGEKIALPKGKFNTTKDQSVTVGIRPMHIKVAKSGIKIQVHGVEQLGGESHIFGKSKDGRKITVHSEGQTPVSLGETIHVSVPAKEMHLFDTDGGVSLLGR